MTNPIKSAKSTAVIFSDDNIDTDQIIPSREIKNAGRDGLGEGLFANQRYLNIETKHINPDCPLNDPAFANSTILICGDNFGCGSSREHAVWSLYDFGFRCIIAPSFGEIFYNNCINNGLAPLTITPHDMRELLSLLEERPDQILSVDIEAQSISIGGNRMMKFSVPMTDKLRLINGHDLITLTQQYDDEIRAFVKDDQNLRAWAYCDQLAKPRDNQ